MRMTWRFMLGLQWRHGGDCRRLGAGKVIAMPDHQMLNMHAYGEASGRLYRNGLAWLGGAGSGIRIVTLSSEIGSWLTNQGYQNVTVPITVV